MPLLGVMGPGPQLPLTSVIIRCVKGRWNIPVNSREGPAWRLSSSVRSSSRTKYLQAVSVNLQQVLLPCVRSCRSWLRDPVGASACSVSPGGGS